MANVTANVTAAATIMSLVIMEGPLGRSPYMRNSLFNLLPVMAVTEFAKISYFASTSGTNSPYGIRSWKT
jgi:hypothetical protein